ncbi:MAG: 50S ribosomal protein L9 [Patescibacteria group bacterium]
MKVILLTDIPKVGNRYDVKEFKEGYAQNVLLSKGLAELATSAALSRLAEKKEKMKKEKEKEEQSFRELISSLDKVRIIIKAKANEKDHLFKAIGAHDIALAIRQASGISVDESVFIVPHIKELGSHAVVLKKGRNTGECTIIVEK